MQPQQLSLLGEQLLRSGVAPRHVRRYLRELRDHYDDAVRDELKKGASQAAAEETAAIRLGDSERLIQSALARPELQSRLARYPGLAFGAGPVLLWVVLFVSVFLLFAELALSTERMSVMYGAMIFFARVAPVVLALGLLVIAFRQRLPLLWPIVGSAIVAVLAGTLNITFWPAPSVAESGLGISSSLLPFFFDAPFLGPAQPGVLAQGLMRALLTMALALVPFTIWRRRQNLG